MPPRDTGEASVPSETAVKKGESGASESDGLTFAVQTGCMWREEIGS